MIVKQKEIVYTDIDRFAVIVASGEYRGVKYVCLNQGRHPSCYVMCSQEFLDKHMDEFGTIGDLHVHGGITYTGMADKLLGLEDYDSVCFGWDYGHAGDWAGYISEEQNKEFGHTKYTTDILIKDCEDAIDQYLAILEKDTNDKPVSSLLTKETLIKLGFTPALEGFDDVLQMSGIEEKKKWKIYIDFLHPSQSYVINQSPRRRYEGEITTPEDLKSIIQLFDLPIVIC